MLKGAGTIKTIKLTPQIYKNDLDRKVKQAQKFLSKGQQVKIQMDLRGRQKDRPQAAVDFLNKLLEDYEMNEYGSPANTPKPGNLQITFNPLKKQS